MDVVEGLIGRSMQTIDLPSQASLERPGQRGEGMRDDRRCPSGLARLGVWPHPLADMNRIGP